MADTIKLAVFAKKRSKIDEDTGKARFFYTYLTTLMDKRTGEPLHAQVKFREACGAPDGDLCPMFITVPRDKINLTWDKYVNEEGEEIKAAKLWVTTWEKSGEYVDHSMDDFDAYEGTF